MPSTDEMVAEYVRSSMRVDPPAILNQEVMRAVAQVPQQRRGWFNALALPTPALAAVAAAALIIAVSAFLVGPRLVGPPAEPMPSPMPTLTAEADRVLTQPGDVIRIPALDSQGQFGTITIERGEERGSYPDYVPFMAMFEESVFFIELHVTYELERPTLDAYGSGDFGYAVDAGEDGFDDRDLITQFLGYSVTGEELQTGPQPRLRWPSAGSFSMSGWLVGELPERAAQYDIYLVQVAGFGPDDAGPLQGATPALLREPGEPVGVTTFDPDSLPPPTGSPEPMPSFQALPTPLPAPAATFEAAADAEAEALFEETQTCTNAAVGATFTFPATWHTNEAYEDLPACSFFGPEPIDAEVVLSGFAAEAPPIQVSERPEFLAGIEQPVVERMPIAGRIAWRISYTADQHSSGTRYLIPLTEDPYGPFLSVGAGPDEALPILDRMLIRLQFSE